MCVWCFPKTYVSTPMTSTKTTIKATLLTRGTTFSKKIFFLYMPETWCLIEIWPLLQTIACKLFHDIHQKEKTNKLFRLCCTAKLQNYKNWRQKIKTDEGTKSHLITCLGFSKLALKMIAYSKTMQSCSHTTVKYIWWMTKINIMIHHRQLKETSHIWCFTICDQE